MYTDLICKGFFLFIPCPCAFHDIGCFKIKSYSVFSERIDLCMKSLYMFMGVILHMYKIYMYVYVRMHNGHRVGPLP